MASDATVSSDEALSRSAGRLKQNRKPSRGKHDGNRSKAEDVGQLSSSGGDAHHEALTDAFEASAQLERLQLEHAETELALDEARRLLLFREQELAILRDEIFALERQRAAATSETEHVRVQFDSLHERVSQAEAATIVAEDVSQYLTAGLREVSGLALAKAQTANKLTQVSQQLLQMWNYTVSDREVVHRTLLSSAGRSRSDRMPRRWKPDSYRLGFYPQLTRQQVASLRSEIEGSGLFDAEWYRNRHPEVDGSEPVEYLIHVGLPEDHEPHPLFDTFWYRKQVGENELRNEHPFLHFLRRGAAAGLSPHPLFDASYYREQNPDIAANENPLCHFLEKGAAADLNPHPAFDTAWYRQSRGEWELGGRNPLMDYVAEPAAWGASPHPLFDPAWYGDASSPGSPATAPPLMQYLEGGLAENRSPHPLFDPLWYVNSNRDALASGVPPLVHFLRSDSTEHRETSPWFDARWYAAETGNIIPSGVHPLIHYVTTGRAGGLQPNPSLPFADLCDLARMTPKLPSLLGYLTAPSDAGLATQAYAPAESEGNTPPGYAFDPNERAPEVPDYWLPDPLREYIMDRFGNDEVPFVRDMMGVISRYETKLSTFAGTYDCRRLLAEVQQAATDPDPDKPIDVSIVMPVYNGLVYTLTCLRSLFAMKTRFRFEVLIGDNSSNDGTNIVIPAIGGRVRYIRHPENLGFLLNCNVSSLQARGQYVILLNNDIVILPHWLDALIGIFTSDPKIGYAGSKLINADGTLQEAGGIFWNDGSAWNYGRNADPRLPEFNYVKDIDYCSGAAIALPMATWRTLDGFDLTFAPAYCEDSDLAFRVRAIGQRAIYQPFAEVVHHEGKTHGVDTSTGIKAYQIKNSEKLAERWWRELRFEHYPNAQSLFYARDRSGTRPHILIVDHYIPQWDQDAGSRTISQYLQFFVRHNFQVTFWSDNLYEDRPYSQVLQQWGIEVIYGPNYVGKFPEWIETNGRYFQYVLLSRPYIAQKYLEGVKANVSGTVVYYGHDLHWKRLEQEYEVTKNPAVLEELVEARRLEDGVCEQVDVILYPIAEECAEIRQRLPGAAVAEIPAYLYDERFISESAQRIGKPGRNPFSLMFVGGFGHRPNVDAVIWLVQEIMPLLRQRDARYELTVVGSTPPDEILSLAGPGITIAGRVSDERLGELYRSVGIAVVPLRFGGGIKGKVIEAFANGVPVVTTMVGLQGIPDGDRLALIADESAAFADRVCEVVAAPEFAQQRSLAAIDFVRRRYSAHAIRETLEPYMRELRN